MKELNVLRTCAILHDIGKPECWAKRKPWSEHIHYTYKTVKQGLGEEYAYISMRHHSGPSYPSEYHPQKEFEKIICLADNLASGADRPEEPKPGAPLPKPPLHLTHVISDGSKIRMRIDAPKLAYSTREVEEKLKDVGKTIGLKPAETYGEMYNFLKESFLRFIPADTRLPINDVSLWDHLKLTAAFATCIWLGGGYKGDNPEKYDFALLSGDADKVSRFINVSSRLPDLRAGSKIVEKATQSAAEAIRERLGPECVIFAGGGGFLAIAPAGEAEAALSEAKQNFEAITGRELTITVNSVVADGSKVKDIFGEIWEEAIFGVRMKKLSTPPLPAIAIEEGVRECDVCRLRPGKHPTAKLLPYDAAPRYETLCEKCYARRFSKEAQGVELEDKADDRGLVAIIKADGDSLGDILRGRKIRSFGKYVTPSRLSTISGMINETCETKLKSIVEKKYDGECIYAGGDDVLAVLPGFQAFDCAIELASAFIREMAEESTLSAGVAVFDKKFPVYVALEAVSQLIRNAKEQPEKASVDFEIISATEMTPSDINVEKREKLREIGLSNRPYKWNKFIGLLNFSKFLGTRIIPSTQINTIAATVRRNGYEAAQDYIRYQMGRNQIPWRVGEELIGHVKTGFFMDAFTVYNAFYRKREV